MQFNNQDKQILLTQIPIKELENTNILIIGNGFISKCLVDCFNIIKEKVNFEVKVIAARDFFVEVNYSSNYDYIINATCPSDYYWCENNYLDLFKICADGVQKICNFAILQTHLRGLLHLSSGGIYGNMLTPAKETDPIYVDYNSCSSYIIGKQMSEFVCSKNKNLPIKIARIFAVMGPHMNLDYNMAICSFIKNKIENKPLKVVDYQILRSYIFYIDLVVWLLNIMIKGKNHYPYNVGSDKIIDLRRLAKLIDNNTKTLQTSNSNVGSFYVPNLSRTKEELGLIINYNTEESIKRTLEFYAKIWN